MKALLRDACRLFFNDEKSLKSLSKKENWIQPLGIIIVISFMSNLFGGSIIEAIGFIIFTLIMTFFSAAVLHGCLKLFGGVANFKKTLTIGLHIQLIPSIVFFCLVIIGFVISLFSSIVSELFFSLVLLMAFLYIPWFIIISTIALSKIHNISMGKTYISEVISLVVLMIVVLIIGAILMYIIYSPEQLVEFGLQNQLIVQ
jgi:hypothetical protein